MSAARARQGLHSPLLIIHSPHIRCLPSPSKTGDSVDSDNKAALHIMANPIFHERMKHLDIDCHVVRNQFRVGFVLPSFVRSKEQLVDLFTKNLSGPCFASLLSKMDLFSLSPGPSCGGDVGIVAATAMAVLDFEAVDSLGEDDAPDSSSTLPNVAHESASHKAVG
ncbi:UNVERIFIED_CONTAM: hypothetical protein Slati_4274900 [Sesamum latifolium]|uniref:Copia protein n=1 Tax=Sesamum latifolium TaxID=2727402 RepID=A0AAW2TDF6_9LAMI